MLQAKFGCLGDRKFLISASWWSKWCDFVNFTPDEHGLTFPKESFRDELLNDVHEEDDADLSVALRVESVETINSLHRHQDRLDNLLGLSIFKQSSFMTLSEAIENDNEVSQLLYERPGIIENAALLDSSAQYRNEIKKTVVERFDYEVLPHSVWQHLYSWYSADVTICRRLAIDTSVGGRGAGNRGVSSREMGGAIMTQSLLECSSHADETYFGQDSYRHQQKFKVFLDLWPTHATLYTQAV